MSGSFDTELNSFHRFISEQLSVGRSDVSPEEALQLWRMDHPDEETVLAVQEALQDMENGDEGVSLVEFDHTFRQRYELKGS